MSEAVIEAKALTKRYGSFTATENVSFEIRKGEVVGFLGPNGAGKTTTMKILTCFIAPSEGTAKVNGCDIFEDSLGARRAIGYLPESTPLYVEMMVAEYLDFVAKMRGIMGDEATRRIRKVVEETGLKDVYSKEIRTLSKGYRQRVGLAQALIHEPPILILDEPMSGLDPNQAIEIRELIRNIGRERTVILSTHNLAEVQATCDRVLIISKGKLVADSPTQELVSKTSESRFALTVLANDQPEKNQPLKAALKALPNVKSIEEEAAHNAGEVVFVVTARGSQDLRADLSKAVAEAGSVLVGLRREEQNLEEIFRQLTTGTQSQESNAATESAAHKSVAPDSSNT